jgi:restriction endonuclease S subunit
MTLMFSIPDSWAWTTLGEIAEVVGGVTKDSKKQSDPALPLTPYLRVANVQRGYLDLRKVSQIRVPEATISKLRLQPGDVLLNEGGDRDKLGRGWVWEGQIENCIHQNHVFRARLAERTLHPKLLAWFANECAREWFDRNGKQSVNLASISLSKIKQLPLPIPPLAEQRRIIATLEDHLSRLDSATNLIAMGDARAVQLERAILDEAMDLLTGTPIKPLGSLLREPLRNGHSARTSRNGSGVRILTLTAVTNNDFANHNSKIAEVDPRRVQDLWLKTGDILIQRSNTPELVGTSALYTGESGWAIFPDLLIRVRVDESIIPEYAQLILSGPSMRSYFRASAKGLAGSMPKIDQNTILQAMLPVPSLEEQSKVVRRITDQNSYILRLREELKQANKRSRQLRRSLLKQAFAGLLIPQNNLDEPVSVLLSQIRSEQASIQPKVRLTRRTGSEAPQKETLL